MAMPVNTTFPVLYIFMRSDLDSLNPGKMCAQAAHAANLLESFCNDENFQASAHPIDERINDLFIEWKKSGNGFGTTIVLDAAEDSPLLNNMIDLLKAKNQSNTIGGVVHDPSYPIMDGKVIHHLPLNTCAWLFGDKNQIIGLENYKLYR